MKKTLKLTSKNAKKLIILFVMVSVFIAPHAHASHENPGLFGLVGGLWNSDGTGLWQIGAYSSAVSESTTSFATFQRTSLVSAAHATFATHTEVPWGRFTITAYSSSVDETDDTPFITASGTTVRDGIVAANFLPFGAKVKIPELYGEKIFVVEDRMNRRYQTRVDIWFPSKAEAKQFGKRNALIVVVEEI